MNFGLCCLFHKEPIKFKSWCWTGSTGIQTLVENGKTVEVKEKIQNILDHNYLALQQALDYCHQNGIKSYRVSSELIPYYTLIVEKYPFAIELFGEFISNLKTINTHNIVISFHPGQHVNIGSPKLDVVKNSIRDIRYHIRMAEALGSKEINIHVGGTYGNKEEATKRFIENFNTYLTREEQKFITLENDELSFGFDDTLNICKELMVRMTYDIHHENCYYLKHNNEVDHLKNVDKVANLWKGLGFDYFRLHLSSPKEGYDFESPSKSRGHSDYIDINHYKNLIKRIAEKHPNAHFDIEAKHKEISIALLQECFKEE